LDRPLRNRPLEKFFERLFPGVDLKSCRRHPDRLEQFLTTKYRGWGLPGLADRIFFLGFHVKTCRHHLNGIRTILVIRFRNGVGSHKGSIVCARKLVSGDDDLKIDWNQPHHLQIFWECDFSARHPPLTVSSIVPVNFASEQPDS
jgi:hypothetical protein